MRGVWQAPKPPEPVKERAWGYFSEALKDKNPDTRKQAVQSMGLIGPREPYFSALVAMVDDKDVETRLAAILSLLDYEDKRTIPIFKKAAADETPEVSFAAAKALWSMKDPEGRLALVLAAQELLDQLAIRPRPHRPPAEELLDLPHRGARDAYRHRVIPRLIVPSL